MSAKIGSFLSRMREKEGKKPGSGTEKDKETPLSSPSHAAAPATGDSSNVFASASGSAAHAVGQSGWMAKLEAKKPLFLKKFGKKEDSADESGSVDPSMRPQTKEEQEREQQILGILEMFRLQGGPHQTELIMAKSGDRLLGGVEDEDLLKMTWYRMTAKGLDVIPGVCGGFYQPSLDDVGSRLLCKCQDSLREEVTGFGEIGPITLSPETKTEAEERMTNGNLTFEVGTVADESLTCRLIVSESEIRFDNPGSEASVKSFVSSCSGVRIEMNPVQINWFTLIVPSSSLKDDSQPQPQQESPAETPASDESQPRSIAEELAAVAQATAAAVAPVRSLKYELKVDNNYTRDVLTFILRQFCFDPTAEVPLEDHVGTPTHDRHDSDVIVAEEFSDGDIEEDTSATTPGEVRPPSPLTPKGNHHSALDFGVSAVVVSTPEAGSDSVVDSSKASQILASVPSFTSEVSVESLEAEVQAANSADVETPIEESTGDGVVSEDASKQPVTLSKVDQSKLTSLQRKCNALSATNAKLLGELKSVRAEGQKAAKMLAEAASALKAEERANTSLKSERESLSARLKQTFEELQAARLDASVKGSSLATLQSQYDKLQVRLQKTEREEKTVAKSLTETSSEINTLKSQITVLQGQLASAEYAHRVAHDALLAMTTERDDLKEAVSTLRKRIRDVEMSQTRTQAELTDSNALIDKLKQSVTSLEEQAAKDHTTISSLRKSSANAERRAEEAEAAMARLKAETDDAVLQLTTTKDGLSRLSMLEAELAAEKAKNEELLAAKNAAVRKAESLQHDLSKKRVFSSAGGMTPERFEELERQNDFLSQQLVLLTAEKNKLKSEFGATRGGSVTGSSGLPSPAHHKSGSDSGGSFHHAAPASVSRPPPTPLPSTTSITAALAQNAQLQRIANELADELHDREMALMQQRATKELLANRITELEAEVLRLKGGLN